MDDVRLDIPLHENPTRQKAWRVFAFVLPLVLSLLFALIAFRIILTRDTLSEAWPEGTTSAVRIIKTTRSATMADSLFHGKLLNGESVETVSNTILRSKREAIFFFSENGLTGAIADTDTSTSSFPRLSFKLIWPSRSGEVLLKKDGHLFSFPLEATENTLTVRGIPRDMSMPSVVLEVGTRVFASVHLSPEEAQELLPSDVPLVYPGIRTLFEEIRTKGLSLVFGQDEHGFVYVLNVEEASLSKENLESFVKESLLTPSITGNLFKEEGKPAYTELRSDKDIIVTSTTDGDFTLTTARSKDGEVVRATQTPHGLILSNRDVHIDTSETKSSDSCLRGAREYLFPEELIALLPKSNLLQPKTLESFLPEAKEVAFKNKLMRVCW
jgi:hypothetical protein